MTIFYPWLFLTIFVQLCLHIVLSPRLHGNIANDNSAVQNRKHNTREITCGENLRQNLDSKFLPVELRMRTHESTGMRKQVGEERHWLWVHFSRKVDSTNLGGTLLPPWIFHPFFCQTSLDGCLLYKSLLLPTCQK